MEIITVASAKGGVGKSTFCCCVGKFLTKQGKRVLLVDMDIGVRSLDILLGVSEKTLYNWGDIIKGNCDYRKAIIEADNELFVLPAPISFSEEYTQASFGKMIDSLKNGFDFIILDSPAGLETGFKLSNSVCETCIVISTPDPVSIRAATYAAADVKKQGVEDVRLVINKFDKRIHRNINVDEFIDSVCARLLGIIPMSNEMYEALNGIVGSNDCKANKAFFRIAKRISGENIPLRVKNL